MNARTSALWIQANWCHLTVTRHGEVETAVQNMKLTVLYFTLPITRNNTVQGHSVHCDSIPFHLYRNEAKNVANVQPESALPPPSSSASMCLRLPSLSYYITAYKGRGKPWLLRFLVYFNP